MPDRLFRIPHGFGNIVYDDLFRRDDGEALDATLNAAARSKIDRPSARPQATSAVCGRSGKRRCAC
jgi:hypothetical protein